MKKILAAAIFAVAGLAATSAHAQSTISPVPGAKDAPHEPRPTDAPNGNAYTTKSDDQKMATETKTSTTRPMRSHKRGHKMKTKSMPTNGSM